MRMLKGIDHLVLLVSDLEGASRGYASLGFHVVPGGRHGTGPHNALITFLDGSYLELIAFHTETPSHRWWHWQEKGGGFIDYCMMTDDLDADLQAFGKAGVTMAAPYPLTRIRPDGFRLDWVIAIPREPRVGAAPFLIRDHTPRAERVPPATVHPNGATGVALTTLVVDNLDSVRRWTSAMPGVSVAPVRRGRLKASGIRMIAGPSAFEYLKPDDDDSDLAMALGQRGPGPYAISLSTSSDISRYDPSLTWGVRINAIR